MTIYRSLHEAYPVWGQKSKIQESPTLTLVMAYMTWPGKNYNIFCFSSYLGEVETIVMIFKGVSIYSEFSVISRLRLAYNHFNFGIVVYV